VRASSGADCSGGRPVDVSRRRRPGNIWASPGPTAPVGSRPSRWTWTGDPGHAAEPEPGILGTDRSVTGARRPGPEVADPKRKGPHGTGNSVAPDDQIGRASCRERV